MKKLFFFAILLIIQADNSLSAYGTTFKRVKQPGHHWYKTPMGICIGTAALIGSTTLCYLRIKRKPRNVTYPISRKKETELLSTNELLYYDAFFNQSAGLLYKGPYFDQNLLDMPRH